MEHEVLELAGFKLVGVGGDCAGYNPTDIGEIWGQLFCRMSELKPIGRMVGVNLPRENGIFYIASAEVAPDAPVPPGMQVVDIPAARWFCWHFRDKAEKMSTAFSTILSDLLPAAGLKAAAQPLCFEVYPPDWMDKESGTMKLDLFVQLA